MAKKKITVQAKCAAFDIEVTANINTTSLSTQERDDVIRKFKHLTALNISRLPFAHIYPYEVTVK